MSLMLEVIVSDGTSSKSAGRFAFQEVSDKQGYCVSVFPSVGDLITIEGLRFQVKAIEWRLSEFRSYPEKIHAIPFY